MKFSILTLFPEMFNGFKETSIIKRALDKEVVQLSIHDFRSYSHNKHHKVDDYPYGGGQGMVLSCQPIVDAIKDIRDENAFVVMMTPQGQTFNQSKAYEYSKKDHIILVCGHYEGFDERIRSYVDEEISIGDYVLTGGELASMVISDACIRLVDGAIKDTSHEDDSFNNQLLEFPQYTRPEVFDGKSVPEVLLSGHHENIRKWRLKKSIEKTYIHRPDLLLQKKMTNEEKKLLDEIIFDLNNEQ